MYKKILLTAGIILVTIATIFALRNTSHIQETTPLQEETASTTQETVSIPTENQVSDKKIEPESTPQPEPKRAYLLSIASDTTVLKAMMELSTSSEFTFSGQEFPGLGFFVEEIGGLKNADGFYWTLFIDGKPSALGVSSARVTPASRVEWRYQKGL